MLSYRTFRNYYLKKFGVRPSKGEFSLLIDSVKNECFSDEDYLIWDLTGSKDYYKAAFKVFKDNFISFDLVIVAVVVVVIKDGLLKEVKRILQ